MTRIENILKENLTYNELANLRHPIIYKTAVVMIARINAATSMSPNP